MPPTIRPTATWRASPWRSCV